MASNMPPVDLANSEQNAFVQDWLTAYQRVNGFTDDLEGAIEQIQETYNYQDHLKRTE